MKERDELLDRLGLKEMCLIHYDISEANTRARTALNRFLFGRVEVRVVDGSSKTYRYPGLAGEGAEWVGQSVFVLQPELADRLITKLRDLSIRHWWRTIYAPA